MTSAQLGAAALEEAVRPTSPLVRLVDRIARLRPVSRRSALVGAAVAGSALATDARAYALMPQSAYATICGPANTAAGGWSIFCATVNRGLNGCPPGSFTAGWWKAADSSWCGGGYRYIVDCNAKCTGCTSGCSDHICDSKCWNCSCRSGRSGQCDRRRECCNDFRYGQCNTQVKCSGGVHCRVVSCVPPYRWESCTTTSLRSDATAEHSSSYLPQWSAMERLYRDMGAQGSFLGASRGPVKSVGDGRGRYVRYEGGRIWDTSSTPATAMSTSVTVTYLDAGGPARLGYPTAARASVTDGGWIHLFEKGAIVDSKSTTTQVVWGARWPVWVKEGRERGHLGFPTSAKTGLADGAWIQTFQKGCIVDSRQTTTKAVWGIRWTKWVAEGREKGRLGFPVASVQTIADGWIQRFQKGCITDSTRTTTQVVSGSTWTAWSRTGRSVGVLGYPRRPLTGIAGGAVQLFENGGVWGRSGTDAHAVWGAVLDRWEAAGGPGGEYGFPTSDTVDNGDGTSTGVFEGGTLTA